METAHVRYQGGHMIAEAVTEESGIGTVIDAGVILGGGESVQGPAQGGFGGRFGLVVVECHASAGGILALFGKIPPAELAELEVRDDRSRGHEVRQVLEELLLEVQHRARKRAMR